jgi:hypothetical protein
MCWKWSKPSLQVIAKVERHFMFPHKSRTVKRKWSSTTCLLELFVDLQEHRIWKVITWRSKSILVMWKDVPRLEQESLPSKHGSPTLIWIIMMKRIGTSLLMPLFLDTTNGLVELLITMIDINKLDFTITVFDFVSMIIVLFLHFSYISNNQFYYSQVNWNGTCEAFTSSWFLSHSINRHDPP